MSKIMSQKNKNYLCTLKRIGRFTLMKGELFTDLLIVSAISKKTKFSQFFEMIHCRNLQVHWKTHVCGTISPETQLKTIFVQFCEAVCGDCTGSSPSLKYMLNRCFICFLNMYMLENKKQLPWNWKLLVTDQNALKFKYFQVFPIYWDGYLSTKC